MTILIGVDLQEIDQVQESMENFGEHYVRRIYTGYEIEDCGRNPKRVAGALASRFAAKEAMFKILREGSGVATWKDVEVRRLETGQPVIALWGVAAQLAHRQGIASISLSLSQSGGIAVAVVVADGEAETNE